MKIEIGKRKKRFGGGNPLDPTMESLAREAERDDRFLRRAAVVAILAHVVLLLVNLPERRPRERDFQRDQQVFMVQQVRFRRPPPRQERSLPSPKSRKIPVPDPTPDDPEPIREVEEMVAEIETPDVGDLFGIPDGPPSNGSGPLDGVPMEVAGNVSAPVKLFAPQPLYTEDARKARVEGIVILQTVIDRQGQVADVKILKGLPKGLTESAVETVQRWRFKPAMLEGDPVAVYFMLSVNFHIQ